MDKYFEDLERYEEELYCPHCGDNSALSYSRTVANGEVWYCRNCKEETMSGNKPREDDYYEDATEIFKKEWTQQESSRQVKEFIHEDQQEVIHVIKTGFEDKYIVVHEDCHEMVIGNTYVGSKEEVENKYKIEL